MVHFFNRDEAQAKMILLKEKADKDLQQHNAEIKEHVRIIDHDKKLRDFMNTKCKERQEDLQLVAWRQRKGKRHHIFDIYFKFSTNYVYRRTTDIWFGVTMNCVRTLCWNIFA